MDAFDIDCSSLLASWALAPEAPRPLLVARICSRGPTREWKFRGKDDSCRSVRDGWVHSGGAKPFRLFNLRITMPTSICGIDAWMKRELQEFLRSFCVCCVAKSFSLESQGFYMSLHLRVHYSTYIWYIIPSSMYIYTYWYVYTYWA